jgi:hypothetical protein
MSKSTPILKKIDPAHLAGPVLNAAFRKDAAGLDLALACVPRQAVMTPHTAYLGAREFLEGRLLLLGLEYWRSLAFANNVNAQILANPDRPAREVFALDEEHGQWKSWALMLDRLLSGMCSAGGIDEEAAREFLSLPPADTETPLTAEESARLDERLTEFRAALLEAGRGV